MTDPALNDDLLWIFLHLPKAGGTTLKGHLARNCDFDIKFYEESNWGREYRRKHNRPPLTERPLADRQKVRFVGGHQATPRGARRDISPLSATRHCRNWRKTCCNGAGWRRPLKTWMPGWPFCSVKGS